MAVPRVIARDEPLARGPVAPAVDRGRSAGGRLLTFGAALVLPWMVLGAAIERMDLPDYGAWTGIRPLEQKLRMLKAFAEAGEVDAVVLGSSVGDFGFSAQRLSDRLSGELGRPYRAFNFSTGAAEVADFPELYRLVRTVARPRSLVLIVCAASGPRSDQPRTEIPDTPVYYLARAPVGSALSSPSLLQASYWIWNLPPVRYAAPLRDLLVFGSFKNLKGVGSDLYRLSAHGDRIGYTYEPSAAILAEHGRSLAHLRGSSVRGTGDVHLSREDVQGLRELARLTDADGCARRVVGHDQAARLVGETPLPLEYEVQRRQYLQHVARVADATACVFLDGFRLPRHTAADYIHLNEYGAAAFTDRAASCWTARPSAPVRLYREPDLDRRDPPWTFNNFSFVLRRDAPEEGDALRLRFVRSIAVPPLVDEPLFVALRQPDDTDLVMRARREGDDITVSCAGLPRVPRLVLVGRLLTEAGGRRVALNQPLASYRWVSSPAP